MTVASRLVLAIIFLTASSGLEPALGKSLRASGAQPAVRLDEKCSDCSASIPDEVSEFKAVVVEDPDPSVPPGTMIVAGVLELFSPTSNENTNMDGECNWVDLTPVFDLRMCGIAAKQCEFGFHPIIVLNDTAGDSLEMEWKVTREGTYCNATLPPLSSSYSGTTSVVLASGPIKRTCRTNCTADFSVKVTATSTNISPSSSNVSWTGSLSGAQTFACAPCDLSLTPIPH